MNDWIVMKLKDGSIIKYAPDEYTDYDYDRVSIIVIQNRRWIGIYNMPEVVYFEIRDEK